jgi:hypothetical protein
MHLQCTLRNWLHWALSLSLSALTLFTALCVMKRQTRKDHNIAPSVLSDE